MNKSRLLVVLSLLATTVAYAQPPEEVPPPLPETSEQITPPPAPAPVLPPAVVPVAEPKLAAPVAPPEDKRIKGINISPSLRVVPIGYDSINITGSEAGSFFSLKPTLGIGTSFKTDTDKTIDFSAEYALEWREYYSKNTSNRDFDNDINMSLGMKVNDIIGLALPSEVEYFFKSGQDVSSDSFFLINAMPTINFTATKELGFKLGYEFWYADNFHSPIGPDGQFIYTDPPTDGDDFRRGSVDSAVLGFNSFDPNNTAGTANEYFFDNRLVLGSNYKFPSNTNLSFTYKYRFATSSNNQGALSNAHYLAIKIAQDLPWKGGKVSLTDELRMQKYIYTDASTDATYAGIKKQDFRNRLTLEADQDINDYMGATLYYRYQAKGKNTDDYGVISNAHLFYAGMIFKF
jgi:hypothetical protein